MRRRSFCILLALQIIFICMTLLVGALPASAVSLKFSMNLLNTKVSHSNLTASTIIQSQDNLPYPSWWKSSAVCDTTKVSNSAPLGASYRGVPACGPIGLPANRKTEVIFPGPKGKAGWGEYEWQCVELSMRFMYLIYGIYAYNANGNQVVDNYQNSTYDPYNY